MQERVNIDPATVTRGITYLYRWWVQAELGIIPEAYVRRGGEATLVCPRWVLIGSALPVSADEINRLREDLKRPVFACCPSLPAKVPGIDLRDQTCHDLPQELTSVIRTLQRHQQLLHQLGEENPERDEWWRTRDAGTFKVWKGHARRLLLYPSGGEVYGFTMTTGTDGGDFFFRSRSCREEGRIIKSGAYKMSDHALPTGRKVSNLDLLFAGGKVLLLRLLPTGAGFKVFPRRVPGFEGSLE